MSSKIKGRSPSDKGQKARTAANKIRKLKGHMQDMAKASVDRVARRAKQRTLREAREIA